MEKYAEIKETLEHNITKEINKYLVSVGLVATLSIEIQPLAAGDDYSKKATMKDIFDIIDQLCMTDTGKSIKSKTRERKVVCYRQVFCKIMKESKRYTLESIGDMMHIDHSSVLYGANKMNMFLQGKDRIAEPIYDSCITMLTKKYIEKHEGLLRSNAEKESDTQPDVCTLVSEGTDTTQG